MTEPVFTPSTPDLSDLMGLKPPPEKKPVPKAALIIGAVVGGLVLALGGFFLGRSTAGGPSTLAEAITEAQSGKLACGSTTGIVTRLCSTTGTTGTTGGFGAGGYGGGGFGGGTGTGGTGTGTRGGGTGTGGTGTGTGGTGTGGTGTGGTGTGTRGGGTGTGGAGTATQTSALAALLGAGAVGGQVTSVDGTTLTLTTRGGTITYTLPSTVTVTKTDAGSIKDLLAGETVYVQATTDSSGKATVSKIFLVPAAQ